eukprot:13749965-Ditylum_brightwellii.AAC.1
MSSGCDKHMFAARPSHFLSSNRFLVLVMIDLRFIIGSATVADVVVVVETVSFTLPDNISFTIDITYALVLLSEFFSSWRDLSFSATCFSTAAAMAFF